MFQTDKFTVWNLSPDQTVVAGAQTLFNVVGRLNNPLLVHGFYYRLNQGEKRVIAYSTSNLNNGRLEQFGDFNINSIHIDDLRETNELVLYIEQNGEIFERSLVFHTQPITNMCPQFALNLDGVSEPQEVGQVVDGCWQIERRPNFSPCISIAPNNAGYDRILLFGNHQWTGGYQIKACLEVTAKIHRVHLLGLLFNWRSHQESKAGQLSSTWSTGLGIYDSRSHTLKIRYGVNVHIENGHKIGDTLLGEAPLGFDNGSPLSRFYRRLLGRKTKNNQLDLHQLYWFNLIVHPEIHSLAVWLDGMQPRRPQLFIRETSQPLNTGSVGIIAYNCGMRLHEFEINPYP